jgi:hypothetical protein
LADKTYGIKVNTIISSVEYLMQIRNYAESIILNFDEECLDDPDYYTKEMLRDLCAFVTTVTGQVDWVMEELIMRRPKDGVVPVSPEEVETMKLYSEMVNNKLIKLKKYNISFKEH